MKHLTLLPQRLRTWLVLLLAAFMGTQSAMAQTKQAYAYVSTADRETLYFYYDTNRTSRSSTGDTFSMNTGTATPGWYTHYDNPYYLREKIKKVVFDNSFKDYRPTTTRYWFAGIQFLTTIEGFNNLYTSEVTDMSYMFHGCNRLATIDFRNVTGATTNLTDNFIFNTSKVTDMTGMFAYCYALTSLDLSGWDTGKVTKMENMFNQCTGLTSLTLGSYSKYTGADTGWNTSAVTNMSLMFGGCLKLTTIKVGSNWSTASVNTSNKPFTGSTKLVGGAGTAYSTGYDSYTYARIDQGSTAPGLLTAAYAPYVHVNGTTVTFYCDEQRSLRTTGTTYDLNDDYTTPTPGWYKQPSENNYTSVVIDPSFAKARPTTTNRWFVNMSNLTSFTGLEYLNTSEVTNMMYMFCMCNIAGELDFSTFNTAKVTSMYCMFADNLATVLDLSSFNTSKVVNMSGMFRGCSRLTTIYASSSFSTANVTNSTNMFTSCLQLKGYKGTAFNSSYVDKTYARLDGGTASPGYFSTKPYAVLNNGTLTFYDDGKPNAKTGTKYGLKSSGDPEWLPNSDNVTKVVFNSSFATARPTSTTYWFGLMRNLTSITGLEYLNTSEVTSMSHMFAHTKLTSIDLSHFNTEKVEYMAGMFYGSKQLTTLDLGTFNTANVIEMASMFDSCTGLERIYVGNGWSTAKVSSHQNMFYDCTQLEGSAGTVFSSSHTDKEYARIDGGTSSPGYLSANAYAVLNSGTLTFYCDGQQSSRAGTIYDIPTEKEEAPGWYNSSITHVVFDPSFALARPKTGYAWFCGQMRLLDITGLQYLNTSEMTSMKKMFDHCSKLTHLDLHTFNTSKVTDMMLMFCNSYNLKTLNLDGWDTSNVTTMVSMFEFCSALTAIYCEQMWKASTNSTYMFSGCNKLKGAIDFDADKTTAAYANPATGYFSYKPYVEYVASEGKLFFYCDGESNLKYGTIYELNEGSDNPSWMSHASSITQVMFDSSFSKARPTTTRAWFLGMSNLTSDNILGMKYLNTSEVTNMLSMFEGCSQLETLNLMNFDTQKVTNASSMFRNCSSLTTIYAISWNLGASSNSMFMGCSNLVGGNGTHYDLTHTDGSYARIDMTDAPGYFTVKPYVIWDATAKTLTFYNDGKPEEKTGSRYDLNTGAQERPAWAGAPDYANTKVQEVIFDPSFATARPTSTYYWFGDMGNYLTKITGIEYLNTSEVTNMGYMFYNDTKQTDLDLSHFNTAKVTNMRDMFYNCGLETIDITSFDTRNVTNMISMFGGNSKLTTILVGSNWSTAKVTDSSSMFAYCSDNLTGGAGTKWSSSNPTDKTYARIDRGTSAPGYLTDGTREAYGVWDNATETFTHYYDWKKSQHTAAGEQVEEGQYYEELLDDRGQYCSPGDIVNVVFDPSVAAYGGFHQSHYFTGLENLTTIEGLENIDTSKERSFASLFSGCKSLTTLDLSTFDTRNVTNMSYMFDGCTSLQNITLGENFSTENVTSMSYMLSNGCTPAVIDAITHHEGFTTANVTSMSGMFQNNYGISGLNLEMFNTANVTNMSNMFNGCSSLTTLTVGPDWTTEAVTSSTNMFAGCTAIVGGAGTAFSSSHVDAAYAHIDGGSNNPGYLTGVKYPPYVVFDDVSGVMTFYADGKQTEKVGTMYNLPEAQTNPEWMSGDIIIRKVVFDPSFITVRPTSLFYWFNGQTSLEEIEGLENLITSEVTDMQSLFQNCQSLTTLDLSTFDTQNVTDMSFMFWGCRNLQHIYVGSGWTTEDVNTGVGMFNECFVLEGSAGTVYDAATHGGEVEVRQFAHVDGGENNPGLLSGKREAYVHKSTDNHTITFYFDAMRLVRAGTTYDLNTGTNAPAWATGFNSSIFTAVFDPSFAEARPTTTYHWFYYMTSLAEIQGLEYLNTCEVTTMHGMFNICRSLTTLDLSTFDTQKVTDMGAMFSDCRALTDVSLSSFDTERRVSFNNMFSNCISLTELDLSSFNTAQVYNMSNMFYGCSHLTTIYVGDGWDASGVTNQAIFTGCTSLVGEAGTTYDADHVDKAYAHIDGGTDNPGYLTLKLVPYAVYAGTTLTFYNDNKADEKEGTVYYLNEGSEQPEWYGRTQSEKVVFDSSFASARPTTTAYWFYSMHQLTSIEGIENLNTSDVTSMRYMFANCTALSALDLSSFNTENVTDMCSMFAACWVLNSLDIRNFNTSKVKDMRYMFFSCAALTTLDLSSFSTPELVATKNMFYACQKLEIVYVGEGWSMAKVTDSANRETMFIGAAKLRGGQGTEWVNNYEDASFEDYIYAHLDGGADNPGYFTEKPAFLRGDVNGDGSVTIADVTALVNIILGKSTAPESGVADVNADGGVTIADVTALVNIILGK
ncbi:MAG: BspA family leucine-rich repeat surface protein [Bacteroidaceae bacterium]|nr:BspA family leucine-rich repeat surface protein [Bacteroidaceae bacterium]